MSKAINMITISTVVNPDDKQDLERLGSFLLALSRADRGTLGAIGAGRVVPYKSDYRAIFDNGCVLSRGTVSGATLFRETQCNLDGCDVKTYSTNRHAEMCRTHWNEIHCEERTA